MIQQTHACHHGRYHSLWLGDHNSDLNVGVVEPWAYSSLWLASWSAVAPIEPNDNNRANLQSELSNNVEFQSLTR